MQRRHLLIAGLAATIMPLAAFAGGVTLDYEPSNDPIKAALKQGKTVFVDYAADWCSTCAVQERIIGAIRGSDPAYDENIVFVRVDWDDYGNAPVAIDRNIPRRSTLIALQGSKELGRIVAGTRHADIKALMDRALAAAQNS